MAQSILTGNECIEPPRLACCWYHNSALIDAYLIALSIVHCSLISVLYMHYLQDGRIAVASNEMNNALCAVIRVP